MVLIKKLILTRKLKLNSYYSTLFQIITRGVTGFFVIRFMKCTFNLRAKSFTS